MRDRLPLLVQNYLFFRYEDLWFDFQYHMTRIARFLKPKATIYVQPTWYKKDRDMVFIPTVKRLITEEEFYNREEFELIREQETELGYLHE
jgi:hypothetical protein